MNSLLTARRNGSSPTPTPTAPPSTATTAMTKSYIIPFMT